MQIIAYYLIVRQICDANRFLSIPIEGDVANKQENYLRTLKTILQTNANKVYLPSPICPTT